MKNERKQEIINNLQSLVDGFVPIEDEQELTMFGLISRYNEQFDNQELIGGQWVRENTPEIAKEVQQ